MSQVDTNPHGIRGILGVFGSGNRPTSTDPESILGQLQNNPQVAQILGSMGLSLPGQLRQNMLLPEPGTPGFFGQHPGLSRGIENAFMGVANMGAPGRTAGENISNVARSVMAIPQERDQFKMQQIMAPFQTAGMLNQLSEGSANAALAQAHADYFKQRGQYYANGGPEAKPKYLATPHGYVRVGADPDDPAEYLKDDQGNNIMPTAGQGQHGTEMERFVSGQMFQDTNDSRKKMGLDPLSQDDFTKSVLGFMQGKAAAQGAGGASGRYGVPGAVTPQGEQQFQRDKETYSQQRSDLEKKRDPNNMNSYFEADAKYPNDPQALSKYLQDIDKQLGDLDAGFNKKYPKVATPTASGGSPALTNFLKKHQ